MSKRIAKEEEVTAKEIIFIARGLERIKKYRRVLGAESKTAYLGYRVDEPGWTEEQQIAALRGAFADWHRKKELMREYYSKTKPEVVYCADMDEVCDQLRDGEKIVSVEFMGTKYPVNQTKKDE